MPDSDEKTYALFSNPTNKKIVAELEKRGAKVFLFPPLEIERTILDENYIAAIKNPGAFDWIIFPDVLTVDYFLQVLQENKVDLFEMDLVQVCAFGEAVADRLRFVQLHADVIPNSIEGNNVFPALSDYIGQDEFCGLKFLLAKENSLRYEIKKKLIESGAIVFELPIYQIKISRAGEIAKLKTLLKGGAIDEFIFSSPTDLVALKNYFDNDSIAETLSEVNVCAANKEIFQALNEYDLKAKYFHTK
jgi:uroporphyrinogen-III synthase